MKRYINFTVILSFLLIAGCAKDQWAELSGDYTLNGVALLTDTLNGIIKYAPLKNSLVYLKKDPASTTYIQSAKTDANGKYSFNGLNHDSTFYIFGLSDTSAVKYSGLLNYPGGTYSDRESDTLRLYPSNSNQNAIHIIAMQNDGTPPGVLTVAVYGNSDGQANGTADGKLFDMTTSSNGIANMFNVPAKHYYFLATMKVGSTYYKATGDKDVGDTGIYTIPLVMAAYDPHTNGFTIPLQDKDGSPVNGAIAYFYRSKEVYDIDKDLVNSDFQVSTGLDGIAAYYNIPAGTYYFTAVKTLGTTKLTGSGTVSVDESGIKSHDPVTLTQ